MSLTPKLPPSRVNRKALVFAADIHPLRAAGYSFQAIRLALLDAGLMVSLTTVKREAAKRPAIPSTVLREHASPPATTAKPSAMPVGRAASSPVPFQDDPRTSKEIAEDFMKGRNTNTLLQDWNKRENRSN